MKHVFIVTYGRSGSTALMMALNRIDGVCIRGQNGGILHPMVASVRQAQATRRRFKDNETGPNSPWHGASEIQEARFAKAMARAFVRHILVPPEGTRVLGYSGIGYSADMMSQQAFDSVLNFMVRQFENPHIIFLTRNPSEVAQSGMWQYRDREAVIDTLEETIHRFEGAHARLAPRSFLIDHAAFNNRPEGLRPLLDWMEEDVPLDILTEALAVRLDHQSLRELEE